MPLKKFKKILIIFLGILILSLSASPGCANAAYGTNASQLQDTLVPAIDLDVYIYINQQAPTNVPQSLTGEAEDISVQSLSIWGIINNETDYTVGGALTFISEAEANLVNSQLVNSADFFTKISSNTIYFVKGSGGPAEDLKSAITDNNFKNYDDSLALAEVDKLPSGGTTQPAIIGIIKPSQIAIDLAKKYLDQNSANTLENLYSSAKPRIIAFGAFSSEPIDPALIYQSIIDNTIWDMDLGIVVSMGSSYPGFIFSPIANQFFRSQQLTQVKVGELTAFKYTADMSNGKNIQAYLAVISNDIFLAASGKDAYAQTLLASINR